MSLTLGLLASVLVLLPGLVVLAAFNYRTRRGGARRPELPLTAVSALVMATLFSMLVHGGAFLLSSLAIDFVVAVHDKVPSVDFGPVIQNPIAAFFAAVEGTAMPFSAALGLAVVLFLEAIAVANFIMSDLFDLAFERVDFNGQGWIFEHVTRPAENGYTPVGHVFTSTMSGKFGIAYKGAIVEVRQGDKGEILSIALARPERFLYELGSLQGEPGGWWRRNRFGDDAEQSGIRHHAKDYTGGIVALEARVINNIVVHSVANSLLAEIDQTVPADTTQRVQP
ncbi:hypothetical protein [Sphingomonas lacusdianchii]|uniref:hypothetical protein n=1 Tax=Sphingomonas lacusdianchii TaxID=2917992 RepID=UPI001F57CCEC|nr:hypothetical protein [Sphingomonas sp. JXJ CY 53]